MCISVFFTSFSFCQKQRDTSSKTCRREEEYYEKEELSLKGKTTNFQKLQYFCVVVILRYKVYDIIGLCTFCD